MGLHALGPPGRRRACGGVDDGVVDELAAGAARRLGVELIALGPRRRCPDEQEGGGAERGARCSTSAGAPS